MTQSHWVNGWRNAFIDLSTAVHQADGMKEREARAKAEADAHQLDQVMRARAQLAADEQTGNFLDWWARNVPPGTVISDPDWWAERIARFIARAKQ